MRPGAETAGCSRRRRPWRGKWLGEERLLWRTGMVSGRGSGRAALAVRIYGRRETGVDGGWFLGSRWNFF
jgi:hypothetical protein